MIKDSEVLQSCKTGLKEDHGRAPPKSRGHTGDPSSGPGALGEQYPESIAGSIPVLQADVISNIFDNVKTVSDTLLVSGINFVILASPR